MSEMRGREAYNEGKGIKRKEEKIGSGIHEVKERIEDESKVS